MLQWVGGIGFIVVGIALLPIMRVGGMQLFRTESSERGDKEFSTAPAFAVAIFLVYCGLTALAIIAFVAGGMTEFEAVVHAFTALSTGGYSTSDASFGHFSSSYLQWMGTLFMLAGALPFTWYIRLLRHGTAVNEQVVGFVLMLAVVIAMLTVWRVLTSGEPMLETLRLVAFNVVSVVTTTGFATTDYTTWGTFSVVIFLILTSIGGCTGSTAGGAKMMRWIICMRAIRNLVRQIRFPRGLFPLRYEGRLVDEDVLNGVITFFVVYAATVFGIAAIMEFDGGLTRADAEAAEGFLGRGPPVDPWPLQRRRDPLRFLSGFKRAVRGVQGRPLRCPHRGRPDALDDRLRRTGRA